MNLRRLVWSVVYHWSHVLLFALAGLALGGVFYALNPVEYTSRISMYVAAQVTDNPGLAYQGAQLSEQRVKSYTLLATSPGVIDAARQQLQLQESNAEIARRVSASNTTDTVIISIDATASDPVTAARLADGVGAAFSSLVARLELPATSIGVPAVSVRAIQPANTPLSRSSSSLLTVLFVGLVLGLLAGVGTAIIRAILDNKITSPEQLQATTNEPTLGTIAYDPNVSDLPVYDLNQMRAEAESYRHLRTNVTYVNVDSPPKVVVVTSSLPGEGKTTVASNLSAALAASGYKVLLVDADLRRPRLAKALGLEQSVGLTTVLAGRVDIREATQRWQVARLSLVASGPTPPNPSELLGSRRMTAILEDMRSAYDYVIIDSPPLLPVVDAAVLGGAADGVLFVCQYNKTTDQQVLQSMKSLRSVGASILGSVLTMVPTSGPSAYAKYTTYYSTAGQIRGANTDGGLPRPTGQSIDPRNAEVHGPARPDGDTRYSQNTDRLPRT